MKNQYILLIILLQLISWQSFSQKTPYSVSAIAGFSPPKQGLKYSAGFGIKAGAHLENNLYAGMALFAHMGDDISIGWGSFSTFNGGRQKYKMNPKFVMADVGYEFKFNPLAGFSSSLMPYFSMGLASLTFKSSGVYGKPDPLTLNKFGIGGGVTYTMALTEHFSLGVEYRMYPLGDIDVEFGDISENEYEHGFSTNAFYHGIFTVLTYRM